MESIPASLEELLDTGETDSNINEINLSNTNNAETDLDHHQDEVKETGADDDTDPTEETEAVEETEMTEDNHPDEEPTKVKLTELPIGRVKNIVKTDPEINLVNQEAVFLITKATELFINSIAKESYKYTHQAKKKTIQKQDVQSAIDNVDALLFLDGV